MEADKAWQNVECAVAEIEAKGPEPFLVQTCQAAIYILMELEPEVILAQVEASYLPTRPTVSWLVHEAALVPETCDAAQALEAAWLAAGHEPLIKMPTPQAPPPEV